MQNFKNKQKLVDHLKTLSPHDQLVWFQENFKAKKVRIISSLGSIPNDKTPTKEDITSLFASLLQDLFLIFHDDKLNVITDPHKILINSKKFFNHTEMV